MRTAVDAGRTRVHGTGIVDRLKVAVRVRNAGKADENHISRSCESLRLIQIRAAFIAYLASGRHRVAIYLGYLGLCL
jgi:hypothetical protein